MPRAIWKGNISFGLVNIPITLHSAEDKAEKISFNMLDKRDMSAIGYQRINKSTGDIVEWGDIVKGYEIEDGQYVIVTDEDFKKANPKSTQVIEILDFVDGDDIDPAYATTPYYLEPGKNGAKAYALLREALQRTGKVGIAKVVLHTRQHLAAVMARGPVLMLELLRFAHELRDPNKLDLPAESLREAGLSTKEVDMAERVVEGMSSKWEPEKYRDDYTADLLALIKRKASHGDVEDVAEEWEAPGEGKVLDLMPLLKKSLEQAGGKGSRRTARDDDDAAAAKPKRRGKGHVALAHAKKRATAAKKKPARRRSA